MTDLYAVITNLKLQTPTMSIESSVIVAEPVETDREYIYSLHADFGHEYAIYRDDEQEYVELPDLTVDFRVPRGLDLPESLSELLVQYRADEPQYSDHYVPDVSPSLYCLMEDLSEIESLYDKALELAEYYVSEGKPDYIIYISSCFVDALYEKRLSLIDEIARRTNRQEVLLA